MVVDGTSAIQCYNLVGQLGINELGQLNGIHWYENQGI